MGARVLCVFKQKTAYEMRISDWSSDVCSSDLRSAGSPRASTATRRRTIAGGFRRRRGSIDPVESHVAIDAAVLVPVRLDLHMQEQVNLAPQQLGQLGACLAADFRSEEHTSELQSLMRSSYAVFCLKKKTKLKS